MGCANRHVEEETLIKAYLMAWNALVKNREDFMEQWTEQLQSENLLEGYRAEKFIEYTDGAESLTEMDTDFMLKTLDHINEKFNKLISCVENLNGVIASDESLGEGFCIGHSYFCNLQPETINDDWLYGVVEYELIPLLKEYWFDESMKVKDWSENLRSAIK